MIVRHNVITLPAQEGRRLPSSPKREGNTRCHRHALMVSALLFRPMERATGEIPKNQFVVFSNAAESVGSAITSDVVEIYGRYKRRMSLAPGNDALLPRSVDRDQVILTTSQQIPAVGRPSNTRQGTEVRGIAVYKLLGDGINYSQATVF